jgi:hypothetical protein
MLELQHQRSYDVQVKALLERLPKHSEAPATLADFCQALNGHNGMKPIQPALDMIAELQDVTCGKLWWESQSYHIAAVMRARGVSVCHIAAVTAVLTA